MTKVSLIAVVLCLSCACADSKTKPDKPTKKPVVSRIVGSFTLTAVDGKAPLSINIKSHRVTFQPDKTWKFESTIAGAWSGTRLSGSGTWKMAGNTMRYTAGDNKGTTKVTLSKRGFTLSPDPVLARGGKHSVVTVYERK